MSRFVSFLLGLIMMLILIGCGGGRGGMTPVLMSDPLPSSTEIRATIQRIEQRADSVLATDAILLSVRNGALGRAQTQCDHTSCTTVVPTGAPPLTYTAATAPVPVGLPGTRFGGITRHGGVVLSTYEYTDDTTAYGLGGWMDYNYFTTKLLEFIDGTTGTVRGGSLAAYSLGDATGTNPVSGSATWTGAMVGSEGAATATFGKPVRGDATLTFDFAQMDLDVAFTRIRDLDGTRSHADMRWQNLPAVNGRFGTGDDGNSIQGQFYGPNHEEVGGVFERNQIIGAFGASRQ